MSTRSTSRVTKTPKVSSCCAQQKTAAESKQGRVAAHLSSKQRNRSRSLPNGQLPKLQANGKKSSQSDEIVVVEDATINTLNESSAEIVSGHFDIEKPLHDGPTSGNAPCAKNTGQPPKSSLESTQENVLGSDTIQGNPALEALNQNGTLHTTTNQQLRNACNEGNVFCTAAFHGDPVLVASNRNHTLCTSGNQKLQNASSQGNLLYSAAMQGVSCVAPNRNDTFHTAANRQQQKTFIHGNVLHCPGTGVPQPEKTVRLREENMLTWSLPESTQRYDLYPPLQPTAPRNTAELIQPCHDLAMGPSSLQQAYGEILPTQNERFFSQMQPCQRHLQTSCDEDVAVASHSNASDDGQYWHPCTRAMQRRYMIDKENAQNWQKDNMARQNAQNWQKNHTAQQNAQNWQANNTGQQNAQNWRKNNMAQQNAQNWQKNHTAQQNAQNWQTNNTGQQNAQNWKNNKTAQQNAQNWQINNTAQQNAQNWKNTKTAPQNTVSKNFLNRQRKNFKKTVEEAVKKVWSQEMSTSVSIPSSGPVPQLLPTGFYSAAVAPLSVPPPTANMSYTPPYYPLPHYWRP